MPWKDGRQQRQGDVIKTRRDEEGGGWFMGKVVLN